MRVFEGVELQENGNGKLKYKYVAYFEKQKDALSYLEKYNTSPVTLAKQQDEEKKHKFSEIYKLYMDELKNSPKQLADISYRVRGIAYNNLTPLHNMVFENITLEDLEDAVRLKSDLSRSSINNIKVVLKGMYKTAMRHRYVSEDISALMIVNYSNESKNPHIPFTEDEINVLWQHTDDFYIRLYLILIYTGMRITELLKMKSEDVFLDKHYMIGGIKTKAGKNRKIPISDKIMPFLDISNEYLISVNGKKLSYDKASKCAANALKEVELEHTFHDARHTCTSLLEKNKVSPLHIKLILGHATTDITDHYTHVDVDDLIEDINKI